MSDVDGLPRRMQDLGCLIVGGTSGIGLAAARRFVEEGARVVVAGLSSHAGALERAGLHAHASIWEETVDVRDEAAIARLFEQSRKLLSGRIDVCMHSAGVSGRALGDAVLGECTREGWEHVMAVNATGGFLTNRQAVRVMRSQRRDEVGQRGAIINVGSVLDRSPSPRHFGTVAYAASKGALRALTLTSAARYASEGIRFALIEPGLVDTPMAARAVRDKRLAAFRASKQPLRRGAIAAADVAEAAVFLASSAARAVTGAVITVDGGWCVSDG
jgi:NAD(P)-dependent dehydrogenase (short-subunit alcohol dehydrogenase family)